MGFQIQILFNFTFLLVDISKVLCWSANELQQNSNAAWVADVPPRETSFSGDERGEVTSAVRRLPCAKFLNCRLIFPLRI